MHRHSTPILILALLAVLALLAGPAAANVDLVVDSVTFTEGPEAGECNKLRIQVRNDGNELGNVITAAFVKVFPTNNAFQIVFQKKVFFSSFQPGGTQQRDVSSVSLPSVGQQYTVQVLADADQQLDESNEGNNVSTQFFTPSETCGGGQCDLSAVFKSPTTSNVPATYPAKFSVRFENHGGAACPAKSVSLTRNGSSVASGSLQALNPGQYKNVGYVDSNHPSSGTYTYGLSYQGGQSDANNNNHQPTKSITFTTPGGGGNDPNPPGCDLQANFLSPSSPQSGGSNVTFTVQFKNGGSATCNGFKVKLMSYNNSRCSGYGSQVGGSRAWRTVEDLPAGPTPTTVSFQARAPRSGTLCYKLGYSPNNYSDSNNPNHRPQKVVSYQ